MVLAGIDQWDTEASDGDMEEGDEKPFSPSLSLPVSDPQRKVVGRLYYCPSKFPVLPATLRAVLCRHMNTGAARQLALANACQSGGFMFQMKAFMNQRATLSVFSAPTARDVQVSEAPSSQV